MPVEEPLDYSVEQADTPAAAAAPSDSLLGTPIPTAPSPFSDVPLNFTCDGVLCKSDPTICVAFYQTCDGNKDCQDGTDEDLGLCANWNCTDNFGTRVSTDLTTTSYHYILCRSANLSPGTLFVLEEPVALSTSRSCLFSTSVMALFFRNR